MNTKELRNLLAQEISDLNDGQSTKEKAAAIARLASSMISAKKLEIQTAKFRIETGTTEKQVDL